MVFVSKSLNLFVSNPLIDSFAQDHHPLHPPTLTVGQHPPHPQGRGILRDTSQAGQDPPGEDGIRSGGGWQGRPASKISAPPFFFFITLRPKVE